MKTQSIFIVPFLASAIVLLAQDPAPPASPAPASPQSEMQKWIAATDTQWQTTFKRDVTDWHEAELNKVKIQYITALEEGIKKASAANDLKGALALRDEQKRFGDTQLFPEKDEEGDAAAVKAIRAAIRVQIAKLEKDRAARAQALHAKYDQTLAQAQAQLTQRQRLDDALLVQTKRDEVKSAWLIPEASAVAERPVPQTANTPPTPAKTPTPAPQVVSSKLRIVSATYGDTSTNRVVDVAEHLQKVLDSGQKVLRLSTRDGAEGKDPAPRAKKETVITYRVSGQTKTKVFPEFSELNFAKDLK